MRQQIPRRLTYPLSPLLTKAAALGELLRLTVELLAAEGGSPLGPPSIGSRAAMEAFMAANEAAMRSWCATAQTGSFGTPTAFFSIQILPPGDLTAPPLCACPPYLRDLDRPGWPSSSGERPSGAPAAPGGCTASVAIPIATHRPTRPAGWISWRSWSRRAPNSRRRGCHFAGTPSPSLLKRLLKGEGAAAE